MHRCTRVDRQILRQPGRGNVIQGQIDIQNGPIHVRGDGQVDHISIWHSERQVIFVAGIDGGGGQGPGWEGGVSAAIRATTATLTPTSPIDWSLLPIQGGHLLLVEIGYVCIVLRNIKLPGGVLRAHHICLWRQGKIPGQLLSSLGFHQLVLAMNFQQAIIEADIKGEVDIIFLPVLGCPAGEVGVHVAHGPALGGQLIRVKLDYRIRGGLGLNGE